MNYLVPNYWFPYVLSGTLVTVAPVMFGIHKALKLAGWPARDRRQAVWKIAVLLWAWFFTALLTSWFGFYRTVSAGGPTIPYGLLIPIVAGATLFKGISAVHEGLPSGVAGPMVVGVLASAISGYFAIVFLLRLVRTTSYRPFVLYRYAAGIAILIVIATGLRPSTF